MHEALGPGLARVKIQSPEFAWPVPVRQPPGNASVGGPPPTAASVRGLVVHVDPVPVRDDTIDATCRREGVRGLLHGPAAPERAGSTWADGGEGEPTNYTLPALVKGDRIIADAPCRPSRVPRPSYAAFKGKRTEQGTSTGRTAVGPKANTSTRTGRS